MSVGSPFLIFKVFDIYLLTELNCPQPIVLFKQKVALFQINLSLKCLGNGIIIALIYKNKIT